MSEILLDAMLDIATALMTGTVKCMQMEKSSVTR